MQATRNSLPLIGVCFFIVTSICNATITQPLSLAVTPSTAHVGRTWRSINVLATYATKAADEHPTDARVEYRAMLPHHHDDDQASSASITSLSSFLTIDQNQHTAHGALLDLEPNTLYEVRVSLIYSSADGGGGGESESTPLIRQVKTDPITQEELEQTPLGLEILKRSTAASLLLTPSSAQVGKTWRSIDVVIKFPSEAPMVPRPLEAHVQYRPIFDSERYRSTWERGPTLVIEPNLLEAYTSLMDLMPNTEYEVIATFFCRNDEFSYTPQVRRTKTQSMSDAEWRRTPQGRRQRQGDPEAQKPPAIFLLAATICFLAPFYLLVCFTPVLHPLLCLLFGITLEIFWPSEDLLASFLGESVGPVWVIFACLVAVECYYVWP